jgi:hypothetical protein
VVDAGALGVQRVVAGDLDGDGDADLVAAVFGRARITWYPSEPEGVVRLCLGSGALELLVSTTVQGRWIGARGGAEGEPGLLLASASWGLASAGGLCLQAPLARFGPRAGLAVPAHDSSGQFMGGDLRSLTGNGLSNGRGFVLPAELPAPLGQAFLPGETWAFQLWSREGAVGRFSDAVAVTF